MKKAMIRTTFFRVLCLFALVLFLGRCDRFEPELEQEPEPSIDMAFIRIAAGTFEMGDLAGVGNADERPVHTVTLTRDFYIGKYEVTQAEYGAVMGKNPSYFSEDDRLPVENVSWYDAIRFANRLSEREGFSPCYDRDGNVLGGEGNPYACEGYRLPTEAEWEYACRAGTTTRYTFGDKEADPGSHAWYALNSASQTHPVGEKSPNAWGLYDVHGNVWEWVYDRYHSSYTSDLALSDPYGAPSGSDRVKRGGAWDRTPKYLRLAYRSGYGPTYHYYNFGFRLARTVQ